MVCYPAGMTEREYHRMKAELEAERDAKLGAAEEEYRKGLEHIEYVWQRFNGGLFPKIVTPQRATGTDPTNGHDRGSLIAGIKWAIRSLEEFTRDDVIAYLASTQPDLKAHQRAGSITSNLSRLNAAGELETVRKATRDKQQVYKKSAKFNPNGGTPRAAKKAEVK
jgi:hypothetical protein